LKQQIDHDKEENIQEAHQKIYTQVLNEIKDKAHLLSMLNVPNQNYQQNNQEKEKNLSTEATLFLKNKNLSLKKKEISMIMNNNNNNNDGNINSESSSRPSLSKSWHFPVPNPLSVSSNNNNNDDNNNNNNSGKDNSLFKSPIKAKNNSVVADKTELESPLKRSFGDESPSSLEIVLKKNKMMVQNESNNSGNNKNIVLSSSVDNIENISGSQGGSSDSRAVLLSSKEITPVKRSKEFAKNLEGTTMKAVK
jgi:hypothetical protein